MAPNLLRGGVEAARAYEETLKRLLRGGFADLSPAEREQQVEQIIQAAALAAMALGSAPLPLLEMPVLAAMVRAIGKVYGVERTGRKVLLELAAALGGALALRQALRLIPVVGGMANASRIYGATWALGRAAQFLFTRGKDASREEMREVFRETMQNKTREQAERAEALGLEEKLRTLKRLRRRGLISEEEYGQKRSELLAEL
jgi:uncharacterized protein (DUF697 family)